MRAIYRSLFYLVLTLFALLAAFPFYYMVVGSFMQTREMYSATPNLWPESFDFSAYTRIFENVPMGRYFLNSVIVSGGTTIFAVLASSAAGYCFARLEFIGKRLWFGLVLATLIAPFQARIIPLYVMFTDYNLSNTYAGIMLPGLISAFGIFLMRQFAAGIPRDLIEAARLDGASEWAIFARIVAPLMRPALAALGVFTFLASWNDYLWPLVAINDLQKSTLPLALTFFNSVNATRYDLVMAAATMAVVPVLVIFLIFQRQIVKALVLAGMK